MFDANVVGTRNVLDAAASAGAERITYVSTANVFGDTRGQVVDETYERPADVGFVSYYDETKYQAHEAALERIGSGCRSRSRCRRSRSDPATDRTSGR
jgi:nucleoside-diphosphate-sugar epimerase